MARHLSQPIRGLVAAIAISAAFLSLRWPWHVLRDSLESKGAIDPTIVAFLATALLMALGLPGFCAGVLGVGRDGGKGRTFVIVGVVSLIAGCAMTLVWIGVSVRAIGETLPPRTVLLETAAPSLTIIAATYLRVMLRFSGTPKTADPE